ncbi:hypothetical protein GCM10009819_14600 [Agromyces tropicus]|uniref:DnaJ homologue subfamily C member 28 conserved domain-containing protein n=1 Tax=Agromyces tropicus TaxID=555371 RepID=A0ABN2U899_9MICO
MVDDARRDAWRYRIEQAERAEARARGEDPDADATESATTRVGGREEGDASERSRSSGPTAVDRAAYVEVVIQQAIRRGEFDDLPGAGKPLEGLGHHDPDWWIRRKIEQERLTGLGPPALTLRVESAELEERLDRMHREREVRDALVDFNRRVVEARRQLLGGPPVVTPTRDVDGEVAAWRERREARQRVAAAEAERRRLDETSTRRRRRRRG